MIKRLTGWFLFVIVSTILMMGWMVNRTIGETFKSFRGVHTQAHLSDLPHMLGHYYSFHGGWNNIQDEVQSFGALLSMQIVLLDGESYVLASTRGDEIGERYLDLSWAEDVLPVMDPNLNVPIGAVLISRDAELKEADSTFFDQLLRGSVLTGIVTSLAAVIGTVFIARSFSAPLKRMNAATKSVVSGRYDVRVEEHNRDEIGMLGKAFNQMAREIGKLERVRRDLVLNVSHDLRTPLTVIQGYLEGLQSGKIADRRSAEKAFDSMAAEIKQLQGLINGLNEVAALDAGQIPLNISNIDLNNLIKQAKERVSWSADAKNIAIKLDLPNSPISANLDEGKMGQVLFNLLDNAVHYTQENGTVNVNLNSSDASLLIEVSDNGEGISEKDLPFIFERFYRAGNSQNRQIDGYGMGLSIAKSIIQAHHGEITAESSGVYGEGCRFIISIPYS